MPATQLPMGVAKMPSAGRGITDMLDLAHHLALGGVVHVRPGGGHHVELDRLAGGQQRDHVVLADGAAVGRAVVLGQSDVKVQRLFHLRAVDGDGKVALGGVLLDAAADAHHVRHKVEADGVALLTADDHAVDVGLFAQLGGGGGQVVPGLGDLEPGGLEQVRRGSSTCSGCPEPAGRTRCRPCRATGSFRSRRGSRRRCSPRHPASRPGRYP